MRERGRNHKLQGVTQAKEAYKCQSATFIQEKRVNLFQWKCEYLGGGGSGIFECEED